MSETAGQPAHQPVAGSASAPIRLPIATFLPAMMQADEFCVRFTKGLDAVLAPTITTIDNVDTYVDPWLSPPDFLDWLASWFGLELDATWPEERRRSLIANALELGRWRGTVLGLSLLIELYTGAAGSIADGGGVVWSDDPDATLPGRTTETVTVGFADRGDLDAAQLERLVRDVVPAHLVVEFERIG